jgi:hypothetical protein
LSIRLHFLTIGLGGFSLLPPGSSAVLARDENTDRISLDEILSFAIAIDAHIETSLVRLFEQLRPNMTVSRTSYKGSVGSYFAFRLIDFKSLHEKKSAEVENSLIAVFMYNGLEGWYGFHAIGAGKTNIQLLAARPDNLSVAFISVSVEITEKSKDKIEIEGSERDEEDWYCGPWDTEPVADERSLYQRFRSIFI